jgi:hypothetical protein
MAYEDEAIITAMNGYKTNERRDIYKGVYLNEELFEFERQELFDGKMSIMLPKKFTDMPPEYAKIKYPSEKRPGVIKMNELGSINFAFSLLDYNLSNQMVKEVKDGMRTIIKRIQPANVFIDSKEEVIGETVLDTDVTSEAVSGSSTSKEDNSESKEDNSNSKEVISSAPDTTLTVGWFDIKSHGLDDKLYQFMYCAPIGGKMMQGIFNCIYKDSVLWKPIVLQVIRSMIDLTKEADENA